MHLLQKLKTILIVSIYLCSTRHIILLLREILQLYLNCLVPKFSISLLLLKSTRNYSICSNPINKIQSHVERCLNMILGLLLMITGWWTINSISVYIRNTQILSLRTSSTHSYSSLKYTKELALSPLINISIKLRI